MLHVMRELLKSNTYLCAHLHMLRHSNMHKFACWNPSVLPSPNTYIVASTVFGLDEPWT